jgi:putative MATE family efflux protein
MANPAVPQKRKQYDRSIVEGPVARAVWKLAWPTMLTNVIGGLQGIIDHAMVGHFVGYAGNAAIGISWQIFLVVIVFISSLYTGMGVLVSRFVGSGDSGKVNRTVYQAFLTSTGISLFILAPLGYVLSPQLLQVVNATPEVSQLAQPYLRIMFGLSFGMLTYFMVGGALRAAGDARTPLRLGMIMTVTNITLNVILIRGLGPIPALGTAGAALGTAIASWTIALPALHRFRTGRWIVEFPQGMSLRPDWKVIRELFRFGLPAGMQGVAMNVAGVLLLRFIGSLQQSAEAQAAYAIAYTELFSLITWTSFGLMSAAAVVAGQNLGAKRPERSAQGVHAAAMMGLALSAVIGAMFLTIPATLLAAFGMDDPVVVGIGVQLLHFLSVSGLFISVALAYTGGLQGTGDTRSPFAISVVSQMVIPLGICAWLQATSVLRPADIWTAILIGHITRCILSALRFRQQKWRHIRVEIEAAGG